MNNKVPFVLSAVIGAVLGSLVTYSIIQPTSQERASQQTELRNQYNQVVLKTEQLQSELSNKSSEFEQASAQQQETIEKLKAELTQLKQQKQKVEKTLIVKKQQAASLQSENKELEKTTELQSDLYQQSRELFGKEEELEAQINKLATTREKLAVQTKKLKKECELFKEGTSWDPKSDSCDKEKLATDQIAKIDKALTTKKQELADVKALITKLGVKPQD